MKDLPRVYVNKIDKEFKNFQRECNSKERTTSRKNLSVKIREIFNSNEYIYKRKVYLTTSSGMREKTIVGKTNDCLLTLDGEKIRLNEIFDIEIV